MANIPEGYDEYLKTFEWKIRRLRALRDAGNRCQRCGTERTLEVHHLRYTNLRHEPPEDLTVLCYECHLAEHEDPESESNRHKNGYRAGLSTFAYKMTHRELWELDSGIQELIEEQFRAYIGLHRRG